MFPADVVNLSRTPIQSDSYENGCSIDTDIATEYYAKDVCAECGECSDPLIANTSPPTVSLPPTVTSSPSPPPTVRSTKATYYDDDISDYYGYYGKAPKSPSAGPTIRATDSPPIVSLPPTVSRGPTSSPTVTFLPIEGSTCSDTCGSERELVNNDNIQERILNYYVEGKMKKIHFCYFGGVQTMNIFHFSFVIIF